MALTSTVYLCRKKTECKQAVSELASKMSQITWRLLVIPFRQFRRDRRQITKQPSRPMVWSGREVHLCIGRRGGSFVFRADVSGAERPDANDGQRASAR